MNETAIKEAIKNKAEEKYPYPENASASYRSVQLLKQAGYTCGGEDAIGFMLKFVEWVQDGYLSSKEHGGLWWSYNDWPHKKASDSFTTEQLLIKFLESEKEG